MAKNDILMTGRQACHWCEDPEFGGPDASKESVQRTMCFCVKMTPLSYFVSIDFKQTQIPPSEG